MLVAVIAAPTASIAATYQPHAHRSAGHHYRIATPAYGFAPERAFQTPDMTGETPTEDRTRRNAAEDPVKVKLCVAELEASGPHAKM
jgi:hypothetical protein